MRVAQLAILLTAACKSMVSAEAAETSSSTTIATTSSTAIATTSSTTIATTSYTSIPPKFSTTIATTSSTAIATTSSTTIATTSSTAIATTSSTEPTTAASTASVTAPSASASSTASASQSASASASASASQSASASGSKSASVSASASASTAATSSTMTTGTTTAATTTTITAPLVNTCPPKYNFDGKCGPDFGRCKTQLGECCSSKGFCGTTPEYCNAEQQCLDKPVTTSAAGPKPTSPPPSYCPNIIRADGKCGPGIGSCAGAECCSHWGRCGTTIHHCDARAQCVGPVVPTASVPQPTVTPAVAPIAQWETCGAKAGTFTCATPGDYCCVAPADVYNGKMTCRPFDNCAPGGETQPIKQWDTCGSSVGTFVCATPGNVCCVAPADVSSGKTTCRPNTLANCVETGHPSNVYPILDYFTCGDIVGTSKCANSAFTCCNGPLDAAVGNSKTTCRPVGDCADN
ncbi:hypothetical protein HDU98_004381 [Podochytrium sp. JEL0797]|nr:hypothetical protein HDU98_004381 [Podochytrium sp. JEL0797]